MSLRDSLILFALVVPLRALAEEPVALTTAYDGTWWVALTCVDTKDRNGPVRGYDFAFPAAIREGRLDGRYGTEGTAPSLRFLGEVRDGGALEIRANGLSGENDYTIGRLARGSPYAYTMAGRLDDRQGQATRREARPCTAVFTRR